MHHVRSIRDLQMNEHFKAIVCNKVLVSIVYLSKSIASIYPVESLGDDTKIKEKEMKNLLGYTTVAFAISFRAEVQRFNLQLYWSTAYSNTHNK